MISDSIKLIRDFESLHGYPSDSILNVMLVETGGTLSTSIKNPGSSATGLIQFLEATAKGIGTTTFLLSKMNVAEQLIYVAKYFQPYKAKILLSKDYLDTYLAVLYPALIGKDDSAIMCVNGSAAYSANKGIDSNNKGFVNKADIRRFYDRHVTTNRKRLGLSLVPSVGSEEVKKKFCCCCGQVLP
ncbi:MAG: hypothetical protein ABI295_02370 [Xanthomarina sp.]